MCSSDLKHGSAVVETRTTTISAVDISTRVDTCHGGTVRLLTVSRIDPRKGLRALPEMVRTLLDRGLDVTLDIVGPIVGSPGEQERDAIVAETRRLELNGRVRCVGPLALDALLPAYRDYDVFVLPTLPGEGIPRVLLEAMSAGVPIVTTRVAGIPSLITHEGNGLLVEAGTTGVTADAVERLIGDPALRRRLIEAGYATARQHTLERQAEFIVDRLRTYVGRPLAAAPRVA